MTSKRGTVPERVYKRRLGRPVSNIIDSIRQHRQPSHHPPTVENQNQPQTVISVNMKFALLALVAAAAGATASASSLTARHVCVDPPPAGQVAPEGAVAVHQAWTQGCCGGREARLTRRGDASVADCMGGAGSFIVCCRAQGGVPVRL
jgi:hypothetical protein